MAIYRQKFFLSLIFILITFGSLIFITNQVYSSYFKFEKILPAERMIDGAIILSEYVGKDNVIRDTQFLISELSELSNEDVNFIENLIFSEGEDNESVEKKLVFKEYIVKSGDSAAKIAKQNSIKLHTLLNINNITNPKRIKVGQKLKIPSIDVIIHKVTKGESIWEISRMYGTSAHYILKINNINDADLITSGEKIYIPEPKKVKPVSKKLKNYDSFIWPVRGRLTSRYGIRLHPIFRRYIFHRGIDIGCGCGTKVKASQNGVVRFVGYLGGYGRTVIIEHKNGYKTLYAHLSRIEVKQGQKLNQGQVIARSGGTGRVTGPHLHFEVRRYNRTLDPLIYIARK
ncbi:MAG: M23 family metallopeptidase [Candidatus Hydrogenedentota bacterium]